MFNGTYSGKRVLVTGHTGFKGSWLCTWLKLLGAKVAGFSMGIPTQPANFQVLGLENQLAHFQGDIRDRRQFTQVMQAFEPEMVFHLAAQSLVRRSYEEPTETFETNAMGTMNLLEAIRQQPSVSMAVLITSDKCYRNLEWTWGYRENDTLGGDDPYSASKACAELITQAYNKSFFPSDRPRLATARAGNVIGGGDWASYRLVPDCVRAWSEGQSVKIRFPRATRPWQHVLEPLSGYLCLGAKLWSGDQFIAGEAFNFGPPPTADHTVEEVISLMGQHWPQAKWEIDQQVNPQQRESTLLKLCCDKALNFLQWRTLLSFPQTIGWVTEWYRTYYEQGAAGMQALTCRQIADYQSQAQAEKLPWAT